MQYFYSLICTKNWLFPTQGEFLPRVWRQREAEHRHGGDQQARHDQVEEVVQGAPPVTANHSSVYHPPANESSVFHLWTNTNETSPDLDGEGDVQVGLRTAIVHNLVTGGGHI